MQSVGLCSALFAVHVGYFVGVDCLVFFTLAPYQATNVPQPDIVDPHDTASVCIPTAVCIGVCFFFCQAVL